MKVSLTVRRCWGVCFIYVERYVIRRLYLFLKNFIDRGEAEAIMLALESGARPLLTDEREARELAK